MTHLFKFSLFNWKWSKQTSNVDTVIRAISPGTQICNYLGRKAELTVDSALDKERSLARDRKWPFTQWGPSCMKMLHCSVMSTEWFHYALRTKCTSVMHEREHGFRERDSGNWLHWWGKLFIVPSRIERAQALWDENWWTTFGSVTQMCHHIEVENDQETDNIWDAPQNQRSESPLPLQFWSSTYTLWLALWFDSHKR